MGSNFLYTIDLNEVQNHQPLFSPLGSSLYRNHHHQAPFNPFSSSSSLPSPSLSYLPFLITSHQDQVQATKFVSNGGSSSSDQMVPNKERRLKLTIRKKDNHQDQIHFPQDPKQGERESNSLKWISWKKRLMKKTIITPTENKKQDVNSDQSLNLSDREEDPHDHLKKIPANHYNVNVKENEYNGSNDCVIRICFDCNTTKTPLWRSGPRGPKSLCNACGIRQRKARRAAMADAAATSDVSTPLLKQKMQNKNKRSNVDYDLSSPPVPKVKKCKRMATSEEEAVPVTEDEDLETRGRSTSSTSSSSDKFYFEDLAMILSKSSAYEQVFPQDEKEAAILLMALSYGLVHG